MKRFSVAALFALIFALLIGSNAIAGSKKKLESKISFHVETHAGESAKATFQQLVGGEKRWFRMTPEIYTSDIVAYRSFPSDSGDYGLELQLSKRANKRLFTLSSTHPNKWLIAQANGRVVDAVVIDKPVNDRILIVWKGISIQELRMLDGTLPYIGESPEKFKARKKALKKSRR